MQQLTWDRLPVSTRDAVKRLVLDTCGAALAATEVDGCREVVKMVTNWGGREEGRVIGTGARVPAHNAALANATMARALEIDDVHEKALLHATATMVPVGLATAELRGGVSGQDFLTAIAGGIDIAARLSLAPVIDTVGSAHAYRPMSYTYQTGILAGSLVAGKLLALDERLMLNALGVAYSQCAGNQQALLEGALTVRVQQGLSASAAVVSAELAAAGVTGALDALEGQYGYYAAFQGGRYERTRVTEHLGIHFEVDNVSIKPYPCCKYTHTAIAATLDARSKLTGPLETIEQVVVYVNNREYYDIVCQPEDRAGRRRILQGDRGWVHGQFCLPYVVSVALVRGSVTLEDFSDARRQDERVLRLMDRVTTLVEDPVGTEGGRLLPTPGTVELRLDHRASSAGGSSVRGYARYAKGHPMDAMSFAEVTAKFHEVTSGVQNKRARSRLEQVPTLVATLEDVGDASELMDLLVWE
ncbi:MAG: MmgE/PrpD family protein [Candidatus Dormibacteria bacterium]